MANNRYDSLNKNAYKCRLTLTTPPGKGHTLNANIASVLDWVDPARQLLTVEERVWSKGNTDNIGSIKGYLVSPAINVILFIREYGDVCVNDIQNVLKKPPWKFHHKLELQNRRAPRTAVASQEFYALDKDLPLFAACPVLTETEIVRIQLHVLDFTAMVEFYRTITETEIETSKPDFCIFELYRQSNLDVQLSLKHCQYIHPIPAKSVYISFNVKSVKDIQLTTSAVIGHISENVFTTRDPDGNMIVLYECGQRFQDKVVTKYTEEVVRCNIHMLRNPVVLEDTMNVVKSSESVDSGQASDMDDVFEGLESNLNKQLTLVQLRSSINSNETRDKSEGYGSSDTTSSAGPMCDLSPKRRTNVIDWTKISPMYRHQTIHEVNSLRRKRPGSYKHKKTFSTPIFI